MKELAVGMNRGLFSHFESGRLVCKAGFDCTKPIGKPFAERQSISNQLLERIDPLKIIGEKRWSGIPVEPWG